MAKFKEIEIKWNADKVERQVFNKAIRRYVKGKKYRKVVVAGFDYYYSSREGYVLRHRHGAMTNELTVKARVSNKSTTVRREINVKLAKDVSPIQIQEMMGELGYDKALPIFKDCDIYFIQDGKYMIDIVWYRVTCGDKEPRVFLEVEVHEAPINVSLSMLRRWKRFLNDNFGVTDSDIVNESLYEIYSGRRYRMSKVK